MHANDQIIRTILGGDINGADVCIEQCLWIDPHFLHLLKYAVVAEENRMWGRQSECDLHILVSPAM